MEHAKLAIVHDYLCQMGGAERVVLELHNIFPEAPVYTSIYNPVAMPEQFKDLNIHTSFMQWLPYSLKFFRFYFLLYPFAFKSFDLSGYDIILSSSSAYAKGVSKRLGARHICYCYTPARFIWMFEHYMQKERLPQIIKILIKIFTLPLRWWDYRTARDVDCFVAISQTVADRIKRFYKRDSVTIYPPVDIGRYKPGDRREDFYLVVSRLNAYKRIDIVVEAFNRLGLPLKIVGEGPAKAGLKKMAGPNIEFLGKLDDSTVRDLYSKCRAFLFPGEEDFGITPLEAMASGAPVIAYAKGGALETVVAGQTGVFFNEQTAAAVAAAVKACGEQNFDPQKIREHALRFDTAVFQGKIKALVKEKLG
ncbi:MAG: glycosyltransferase [Candidatus Margulisiibacteriota bacterium]